jgi:hypothetical protein
MIDEREERRIRDEMFAEFGRAVLEVSEKLNIPIKTAQCYLGKLIADGMAEQLKNGSGIEEPRGLF